MRNKSYLSLLMVALCLVCVTAMSAQDANVLTTPQVSKAVGFVVTPPLRDMIKNQQDLPFGFHQANPVQYPKLQKLIQNAKTANYNVHDKAAQPAAPDATVPTKVWDVLGVGNGFFGYRVPDAPTDGNLSIGDTQIVQWVNVQFAVFDLAGNNLLDNGQHYVNGNVLFTGTPSCGNSNSGDIIAQWDKVAHRWVMMQPKFSSPYRDCFAISQTPDFLGSWFVYEFPTYHPNTDFPDYPKVGIWPDAYYTSHNDFFNLQSYSGAMPCAYDRVKMLAGDPSAQGVCFLDNSNGTLFDDSMLPGDLDSPDQLPSAGQPNIYMGSIDNGPGGVDSNVYFYHLHVDWTNPANSTFDCVNGACKIPVTTYTIAPGSAPEPGGSVIDTLSDRLMYRLAYRVRTPGPVASNKIVNVNKFQNWLVSHAVANNGTIGARWYEFRAPYNNTTNLTAFQQGTYSPDSAARFMSSLAMDKNGNIAMSYTVTSSSIFPTIAFTGRASADAPGTMGAETLVLAGAGSQTDTSNRWGDYYDMAVSNDGCNFVTTGEYYQSTSSFNWSTRIAKLKFDTCTPTN